MEPLRKDIKNIARRLERIERALRGIEDLVVNPGRGGSRTAPTHVPQQPNPPPRVPPEGRLTAPPEPAVC
jgi:hypothetical protein